MYEDLQNKMLEPLRNGGPVIFVSRSNLAMPGAVLSIIPIILVIILAVWRRLFPGFSPRLVKALAINAFRVIYVGFALMIAVPLIAGTYYTRQIEAKGYVECPKLFKLGVAVVVHGYVQHPLLCVSKDKIDQVTALYPQLLNDEEFRKEIERRRQAPLNR
jgi:hypothetical protein